MIAEPFHDPELGRLLASLPIPRRALFLDRDGVINVDRGYVHRPDEVEWVPGIFDLVAAAHGAGYLPVVVTNQAGIARGYYDVEQFLAFTAWMHAQFRDRGTPIGATYYCPHHPTAGVGALRVNCNCRKPAPGMLINALERWAIDAGKSILIGDKASDARAAATAGVGRICLLGEVPGCADHLAGNAICAPGHAFLQAMLRDQE